MYIASKDVLGVGSTGLHIDMTSAINLMVYDQDLKLPSGGAIWHVFLADDANTIRMFLRSRFPRKFKVQDPIHAQAVYLNDSMLQDLAKDHAVVPFRILQRVGEAVLIPAGCPHQASS